MSTPKHHADSTAKPTPTAVIRVSDTASSNRSSLSPGASTKVMGRARARINSTPAPTTAMSEAATAPATRPASWRPSSSPEPSSLLYTGTSEADSTPSPSRFWSRLGMRTATAKASAAPVLPSSREANISRTSPAARLARMPAATAPEPDAGRG